MIEWFKRKTRLKPELIIQVTEEHIKQGKPCFADSCPIALAFRETTGLGCIVGREFIRSRDVVYKMPLEGSIFISKFDSGCAPFPITLTLKKV